MYVIFLDVDGVLNNSNFIEKEKHRNHMIDDDKLLILKQMVTETGAELVLSSSWRSGWTNSLLSESEERFSVEDSKYYFMLCAKLHDYGLNLLSEIPRISNGNREEDIAYWIQEWPGEKIDGYVILDDNTEKFSKDNKHLILTSPQIGLEKKHVEQAMCILDLKTKKKKLLIVDDAETNRNILNDMLNRYFEIIESTNGKEALELLKKETDICMVITDLVMPEMDGIELIKAIRSNSSYNRISIIANTQYGERDQEEKILELGADDFIYKPSNSRVIIHRVRNVLRVKSYLGE